MTRASTKAHLGTPSAQAASDLQRHFFAQVETPFVSEVLFDHLTDLVFFLKNTEAQYVVANQTLADRCGLKSKEDLIGRTSDEIFPQPLGDSYREQDERVITHGESVLNQLELHLYPSRGTGWCLTNKVPLRDKQGTVVGLAGVSKDLYTPGEKSEEFSHIAEAVSYIQTHYHQPLKVDTLAALADLSTYQFERRLRKIFQLTAGQFIQKTRMDAAVVKLRETQDPIAQIAIDCGYSDQSAFSRQFKQAVGLSPGQFRRITQGKG